MMSFIKLINMNAKLTFLDHLYNFSLVKYEPKDVILVHKQSKQPYNYYQLNHQLPFHPHIEHPCLCRPILFKNGAIYPRGHSNLFIQLDNKLRSSESPPYTQQQLFNTFNPIIQVILDLHKNNIVHGALSPKSVLLFDSGDIIVKDWLYRQEMLYYSTNKPSISDDLKTIGLMLAQATCLKTFDQIAKLSFQEIVTEAAAKYTKNYCYGLIILLKGMQDNVKFIINLLKNEEKDFKDEMVLDIYNKCKKKAPKPQEITLIDKENPQKVHKLKKEPISESKLSNFVQTNLYNFSPNKKLTTTHYKKNDSENKKAFNEQVKKKQIQKISKIIERSNEFVNQLMTKKNNEKKMPKNTLTMYESIGSENSNLKKTYIKEPIKLMSPTKKLRTTSKKK